MFAGLVVEVEGPLGLGSWAAIIVCSFVVVAAMGYSSVAIVFLSPKQLGGSIAAAVFGICLDAQ
jgi:hypothetical protein